MEITLRASWSRASAAAAATADTISQPEQQPAASEAVRDVEKRLGPLMQLQELTKTTEEKLTAINALAEHVNQKAKALEAQKHTVDRAIVEASRLNEMVWNMDVQIGKLNEGLKQIARGEETVARIEKLVEETNVKADLAAKAKDEFARESAKLEKDGRALVDVMRGYVEKLQLEKREYEAFDQRLRALQRSVIEAEGKMEGTMVAKRGVVGRADGGVSEVLIVLEVGVDPPVLPDLRGPEGDGFFEIGLQFPGQGAVAAFKADAEIRAFEDFNALPGLGTVGVAEHVRRGLESAPGARYGMPIGAGCESLQGEDEGQ